MRLIAGVSGQDGSLMAQRLVDQGHEVVGLCRRTDAQSLWRLRELNILNKLKILQCDLRDSEAIQRITSELRPTRIYHFAGESRTIDSLNDPGEFISSGVLVVSNLLDAVRLHQINSRIFIASSSEIFGKVPVCNAEAKTVKVNLDTIRNPVTPYGILKSAITDLSRVYRDTFNMYVCNGILFNHESYLRPTHFVSKKIISNMTRLRYEGGPPFTLGSLDAMRDWSDARDIVQYSILALEQQEPRDYLLGSGIAKSIRDIVSLVARLLEIDGEFQGCGLSESYIDRSNGRVLFNVSARNFRVSEPNCLVADMTRSDAYLSIGERISFEQIITDMVKKEIMRYE